MEKQTLSYVIDAGNTRLKIAHFQNDEITQVETFYYSPLDTTLNRLKEISSEKSLISSVVDEKLNQHLINALKPNIVLSNQVDLPIKLDHYLTQETLGVDRIANSVAAHHLSKQQHSLVIDIGTCIKFDMTNAEGYFLGGSIAPGVSMRYKSMALFTGKLPEIHSNQHIDFIGRSTEECLNVGVINAITHEIQGFIAQYSRRFENLTIFLTGGDHKIFDKAFKNSIFVDENLTLKGLHLILKHNAY